MLFRARGLDKLPCTEVAGEAQGAANATVCTSGHHCVIVYADGEQLYPQNAKRPGVLKE